MVKKDFNIETISMQYRWKTVRKLIYRLKKTKKKGLLITTTFLTFKLVIAES